MSDDLRTGVANVARNLRNIGEGLRDDDPILEAVITDTGVSHDVPMSTVFLAAADALDDLLTSAAVEAAPVGDEDRGEAERPVEEDEIVVRSFELPKDVKYEGES